MLARFLKNDRGNVAVMFALGIVPIFAAAGVSIDYSRAAGMRTEMQKAADATALAMVIASHNGNTVNAAEYFRGQFQPGTRYDNLDIKGNWVVSGKRYRLVASATTPTLLTSMFKSEMDVSVATAAETTRSAKDEADMLPATAVMEPEASDYNELQLYCFKKGDRHEGTRDERLGLLDLKTGQRGGFFKIADNSPEGLAAGVQHPGRFKGCGVGEVLSYHMYNVRDARTNASKRKSNAKYYYYTDTTIENGVPKFNTQPDKMIETIYCDTKEKCSTPKSKGGSIPDRKTNRNPQVAQTACKDGFMYMGWEDRPPTGSSDRDYDDIRIVMECNVNIGATEEEDYILARLVE